MIRHGLILSVCTALLLACGEPSCPSPFVEDESGTSCVCPDGWTSTGDDCVEPVEDVDGGSEIDAATAPDAGRDAGLDADAPPDTGIDGATLDDAGTDAAISFDSGVDGGVAADAGPELLCGCPEGQVPDCSAYRDGLPVCDDGMPVCLYCSEGTAEMCWVWDRTPAVDGCMDYFFDGSGPEWPWTEEEYYGAGL